MKTLYMVYGDTFFQGYGADIHLFGVFDSMENAKKAKEEFEQKYYKKAAKDPWSNVESLSDVKFNILELNKNESVNEYLGGYIE